MRYFNFDKHWPRVAQQLRDPKIKAVLDTDFFRYIEGRYGEFGTVYDPRRTPRSYESCDWDCGVRDVDETPEPEYWQYVKHGVCHWLVNVQLKIAQRVLPHMPWRILTSDLHSTVWNGADGLFDWNFRAIGIAADEAYHMARGWDEGKQRRVPNRELAVGKMMRTYVSS